MRILKKIVKFFVISFVVMIICILCMYGYSYFSPKLEIEKANNIIFYDNEERVFSSDNDNSKWINLDDISKDMVNCTLSTEDKNFYKHFGFDIFRIGKAMYTNIISKTKKQGASTITQQYVKNLYLDFDKTWKRKWDEMWLTLNMETHYSKKEILEGYLNTIYYGHGMYGVESASNYYFGKSSKDLSLGESSLLVTIPKAPSLYDPINKLEACKKRQKVVLSLMYKNGYISEDELNNALNEDINIVGKVDDNRITSIMYFKDAVIDELETIDDIPTSFLDTGGLKIFTTLDLKAQESLDSSINSYLEDDKLQVSGMMMNPNNGEIIALIGGRDYNKSQFNRATMSKRQVGSTMKPFLYYAALENGFTPSTTFTSEETNFVFKDGNSYKPQNAGKVYGNEPISMAAAISYSDNIYAIKTHIFLGEEVLVNMSKRLGISTKLDPVPSLPLGTYEINMVEMTRAYATFANSGYKVKDHLIRKILDSEGNVLYEYKDEKELILNQSLCFILNDLLTTTYDSNFIDYNKPTLINVKSKLSKKYSVKSGSTATDSWTIGYNPDVVSSIWVGNDNNEELSTNASIAGKNIWAKSIDTYLEDKDYKWYDKPNNVVGLLVNPISGKPITNKSTKKRILYYLKGTEPDGNETVFDEIYDN